MVDVAVMADDVVMVDVGDKPLGSRRYRNAARMDVEHIAAHIALSQQQVSSVARLTHSILYRVLHLLGGNVREIWHLANTRLKPLGFGQQHFHAAGFMLLGIQHQRS